MRLYREIGTFVRGAAVVGRLLQENPAGPEVSAGSGAFWLFLFLALLMICCAGAMSGLTMGLVSLDPLRIAILSRTGTPEQRSQAGRVAWFVSHHHWTLVTLLLGNAIANEALPIFLDKIAGPVTAVILSVTAVLLFGEVIPAAFCTGPQQLKIASTMAPLVTVLIVAFAPLAWPISKLLDHILGHEDDAGKYERAELRELLRMHSDKSAPTESSKLLAGATRSAALIHAPIVSVPLTKAPGPLLERHQHEIPGMEPIGSPQAALSEEELAIVEGVLGMSKRRVSSITTPLRRTYMLPLTTRLDSATRKAIVESGCSRIPVYDRERTSVVGMILTKFLILPEICCVNDEDAPLLSDLSLQTPIAISPTASIVDALHNFQTTSVHLALVCNSPSELKDSLIHSIPPPPSVHIEGIVTLEDVMESILRERLDDESDALHDSGSLKDFHMRKKT